MRTTIAFFAGILLCAGLLMSSVAFGAQPTQADATATPEPEEEPMEEAEEEAEAEADEEADEEDVMEEELEPNLVTARVHADLVQPGRVLMSARGNHWVYDSVPPLNGPNEEVNPFDGMLAALVACGMYIYEAVAIENDIEFENLHGSASAEFDPRGGRGEAINPRVRALSVTIHIDGPDAEEAEMMAEAFALRCPIYSTLALSAPIEITNVVDGEEQEPVATEADPIVDRDEMDELEYTPANAAASGRMIEFGRSLMSARGNHWIFDSVPPINGPNEEVNPLDALVGALPACGIMIYEAAAREHGMTLNAVSADVEADLDPRGVAGANVNPRIRAFRVTMHVDGPSAEEAAMLADEYSRRCPMYTTFERSAPIEVTNRLYDGSADTRIDLGFVNHIQGGMIEPDVHLISADDEEMVYRLDPETAAEDDGTLMEQEVYRAAEAQEHDMFELGENPRGPFAKGEALGFTMGEWLAATGGGTYTVDKGIATVEFQFQNLVPGGLYTLWCSFINTPPDFSIESPPCGAQDGSTNAFTADEEGNGSVQITLEQPQPHTLDERVSLFALAYHSDGQSWGASPGEFSVNSHVQLFAPMPPAEMAEDGMEEDGMD